MFKAATVPEERVSPKAVLARMRRETHFMLVSIVRGCTVKPNHAVLGSQHCPLAHNLPGLLCKVYVLSPTLTCYPRIRLDAAYALL